MGSLSFVVTLQDGAKFGCLYSGASDFIELPDPYTPADIVNIDIGRGLAKGQRVVLSQPEFVWCSYQESPESQLERASRSRNVLDLEEIGTTHEYAAGLRAENWLLVIGADALPPGSAALRQRKPQLAFVNPYRSRRLELTDWPTRSRPDRRG